MGINGLREQILANAKQVMINISAANSRHVNGHELLVREDNNAFKAVIISNGKLRLEGAGAASVTAALESLLNTTTQMLEGASEAWEGSLYAGEKVALRDDGTRIAMEATPEPEDVIANDEGEENAEAEEDGDAAEVVVAPKTRGRAQKVTKASTGKPRGRPPKAAAARASAGSAGTAPKRKPGRPKKYAT
ncbi:hypothetical protein LTR08_008926 [Meristemomyces frigidus]|nr:hypothetical protein LTR08_008926 [Meristemomyces frigidus]